MINEILDISKKLISIKSDPDNSQALNEILTYTLSLLPDFTIEHFEKDGVKSALVYVAKNRPEKFKILFNCHLDVIPGKPEQYEPYVKDGRLYGVGSMDMKSNLTVALLVFRKLAHSLNYPIALQLVTDEEIGGFNGTKHQVEQGVRADFVIATEPSNFEIVNKAKGVLWLKITSYGKTAHGAYPWKGDNAVWKMHSFLNEVKKSFPIPEGLNTWISTANLSFIETNHASFNKIPDKCTVSFDIRFTPEDAEDILEEFQALVPEGFDVEVIFNEPALLVPSDNEYVMKLQEYSNKFSGKKCILRGANGTSDARHFTRVDCNGVEFGPIGDGIGTDNEWVDISSLEKYYQILEAFLLNYN